MTLGLEACIIVATMYVDFLHHHVQRQKRTSDISCGGRIAKAARSKHDTIANLAKCSPEEVEAIRLALRHKDKLPEWIESRATLSTRQGASVGAVWLLFDMARQLGIDKALGPTREGRLALWQVIARAHRARLAIVGRSPGWQSCRV